MLPSRENFPLLRSIRGKAFLIVALLLLFVFGTSSYFSISQSIRDLRVQLEGNSLAFAELSMRPLVENFDLYYDSGFITFRNIARETLSLNEDIERVQIVEVNGRVAFDSSQELGGAYQWEGPERYAEEEVLPALVSPEQVVIRNSRREIAEIVQPYFTDWGAHRHSVRYFVTYARVTETTLAVILDILALTVVFILASFVLLFLGVDRLILSPIARLRKGTERIGKGEYSYQIDIKTGDELETLAESFNDMARRVAKSIEDLKELDRIKSEFVTIASHNLRTPLTVIKGALEALESQKTIYSDEQLRYLGMLERSISKLEGIIRTLLNVVNLEAGKPVLEDQEFDFCALTEEVFGVFSPAISQKKISVKSRCDPSCRKVFLAKELVSELLSILVDNAIKFNKEGGSIEVTSKVEKEALKSCVLDTGVGIKEEEKDRIFVKFHRATDILKYDYEGIGLGLYVARLICKVYGGKIYLKETRLGEGSTFCFEIPLGKKKKAVRI